MKTYIALTLGPITEIAKLAENTRGLWASSYLFSYFAKRIFVEQTPVNNGKCECKWRFHPDKFLLPYLSDEMRTEKFSGAGVLGDRYIFESEKGDFNKLNTAVTDTYCHLADKIASSNVPKDNVKKYLLHTLKAYYFEIGFEETKSKKDIVHECEKRLAIMEQQSVMLSQLDDSHNYLTTFFDRVTDSFLTTDAWGDKISFPTLVEISSSSPTAKYKFDTFAKKDKNKEDDDRILKPYEKYIAVVYSDGDSMGRTLSSINEHTPLSKGLFEYNKESTRLINNFGGLPVFCAGDDLFFFAPIYNDMEWTKKVDGQTVTCKGKTIFDLLEELKTAFNGCITKSFDEYKKDNPDINYILPTLSFGISVTYYKFPMIEAIKLSQRLLNMAKNSNFPSQWVTDGFVPLKNNIVYSVQKHSGQTRGALLHNDNTKTLNAFHELLRTYISSGEKSQNELVTSLMHSLREKEAVLYNAIKDAKKLENFFFNNFDESIHEDKQKFFSLVQKLMINAYEEYQIEVIPDKKVKMPKNRFDFLQYCIPHNRKCYSIEQAAIDTAYNALQFIHLINSKDDINHE